MAFAKDRGAKAVTAPMARTPIAEPAALEHARGEPHVAEPLHRPWLSLACAAGVLAMMVFGLLALPREDAPLPAIARYAVRIALPRWHITDVVNEIVYGTRAFDTFGETFLLLGAVVSVATLARRREPRAEYVGEEEAGEKEQQESDPDRSAARAGAAGANAGDRFDRRDDQGQDGGVPESEAEREARRAEAEEAGEDTDPGSDAGDSAMPESMREPFAADTSPLGSTAPEHSEAMTVIVRVAARAAAIMLGVAAIYLCARGYTPGGGFPGGAALSGVGLLLYAALGYRAVARVLRPQVLEPLELAGALVVVALAVLGFVLQGSVLANWLPLAPAQTILSGGLLQAFSVTELLEVGTGLSIAIFAMLTMRHDWTPDQPEGEQRADDRPAAEVGPGGDRH
jgi:multicomponent Na+:H+ antiporter subunit B